MKTASIVIPAYNEEQNIRSVIKRIRNVSQNYEIIVVDDGSQDKTSKIAKDESAVVITLVKNSGKGFACMKGAKRASCEKIVFIDADLQLSPEEIPKFVKSLEKYDLAIGARDMKSIPFQRRLANALARKMISNATGEKINDALCGFRAVKKKSLMELGIVTRKYEFESEMLIKASKKGLKIQEVPVKVNYESYKGMGIKDSIRVLLYIMKEVL